MEATTAAAVLNPIARRGTHVDIRVGAKNLVGSMGMQANAIAVVFMRVQSGDATWKIITQSETKKEVSECTFARVFPAEYKFELFQEVRIVLFDEVRPGAPVDAQHVIGLADTSLGDIIAARGTPIELQLSNGQQPTGCYVSISADEVEDAKKDVILEVSIANLMTPDEKSEQDVYLSKLSAQLNVPTQAPAVERRPMAALGQLFKKEEKAPAVRPAMIENIIQQEESQRQVVQAEIAKVQTQPAPFVPYLCIFSCPSSAVAEFRDWKDPNIPWELVHRSKDVAQYTDLEAGMKLGVIDIPQMTLNGGDDNRYIKIAVRRTKTDGSMVEVGAHYTTVSGLKASVHPGQPATFRLEPSVTATFTMLRFEERIQPSFLDTLRESNLDMSLIVGIDFTQSNGQPEMPNSLHHVPLAGMPSSGPNPYEAAIQSVANLLSAYSSDRRIAAFGFGAKIPPSWEVNHCFSLTGDSEMPLCDNVADLLAQYHNVLPRIQLWGPTMFSELLFHVKSIVSRRAAAAGKTALAYTTALIVTDGVISDMDRTREQLIELSRYPCSIIMIGVGGEDFSKMRQLDDSNALLKRGRDEAARRFVQFVDYRSFAVDGQIDLSRLSECVLGNIPDHVVSYIECDKRSGAR